MSLVRHSCVTRVSLVRHSCVTRATRPLHMVSRSWVSHGHWALGVTGRCGVRSPAAKSPSRRCPGVKNCFHSYRTNGPTYPDCGRQKRIFSAESSSVAKKHLEFRPKYTVHSPQYGIGHKWGSCNGPIPDMKFARLRRPALTHPRAPEFNVGAGAHLVRRLRARSNIEFGAGGPAASTSRSTDTLDGI